MLTLRPTSKIQLTAIPTALFTTLLIVLLTVCGASYAQAATTHHVYCSGFDDTVKLESTLSKVASGDTIKLHPRRKGSPYCKISNGLRLGRSTAPGGLTNITFDGNGMKLVALNNMTTTSGDGVTYSTAPTSEIRAHMLTFAGVDGLVVKDLIIDGNRYGRATYWGGISSSSIYGNSGNLALIAVRDAQVRNISSYEAFSDSVYIDGHEEAPSERIFIDQLNAYGAWRNNVTISDCHDCAVLNSDLHDGLQSIDIEPYVTTTRSGDIISRTVSHFLIRNNTLMNPTGRCMSISQVEDTYVHDINIERNLVVGCKQNTSYLTHGRIFQFSRVNGLRVTGNIFDSISASSSDGGGKHLIRFSVSWDVEFKDNEFYNIKYDPSVELLYIWDDSGDPSSPHHGAQATVHIENNRFYGISYTSDPTMWCWVSSSSSFKSIVEANTIGNLIPGPFGRMITVNGCTM